MLIHQKFPSQGDRPHPIDVAGIIGRDVKCDRLTWLGIQQDPAQGIRIIVTRVGNHGRCADGVGVQGNSGRDRQQPAKNAGIGHGRNGIASHEISDERAAAPQRNSGSNLKVNVAGVGSVDQDNRGGAARYQAGADLDHETRGGIVLSVQGQDAT